MKRGWCAALMALVAVVAAVIFYLTSQPPPVKPHTDEKARTVDVYRPAYKNGELVPKAEKLTLAPGVKPKFGAVANVLSERKLFGPDVRLLAVTMKGDVAELNFSRDFRGGYSTDEEEAILKLLSATLGQFPDVKSYRILVEGKPIDTLGSADLTEPVEVTRKGG